MQTLFVFLAVTCAYVTFFVILIPLEMYFVYITISHLIRGQWLVPTGALIASLCYIFYLNKTKRAPFNGEGAPMKLLRHSTLYKYAAKYRPTRLHKTVDLPSDRQYIFGVHPHSTIPTYVSIGLMTEGCHFSEVFPGITRRGLAASTNFLFPIWREVYLWLGYVDASKNSAKNVLKHGHSIVVLVGGEQEMIKARPNENILCLRNRKGFVRLALESGISLVPVFAFRANDCYSPLPGLEKVNKYLSKRYRIVLPVVLGVLGTPWPRKVPVDIVVGEPIPVEQNVHYTDKDVDKLHQQYVDSLENLYHKYKQQYGCHDRELVIIDAE